MDFDDKTACPLCGKRVRLLAMSAHQHGPYCRAKQMVDGYLAEGRAPFPNAPWMLVVLEQAGIEYDLEPVTPSSTAPWLRYDLGYVAPEWAVLVLRVFESTAHAGRYAREALELLKADENLRVEVVVLFRLGGLTAARRRLRELLVDPRDNES